MKLFFSVLLSCKCIPGRQLVKATEEEQKKGSECFCSVWMHVNLGGGRGETKWVI